MHKRKKKINEKKKLKDWSCNQVMNKLLTIEIKLFIALTKCNLNLITDVGQAAV